MRPNRSEKSDRSARSHFAPGLARLTGRSSDSRNAFWNTAKTRYLGGVLYLLTAPWRVGVERKFHVRMCARIPKRPPPSPERISAPPREGIDIEQCRNTGA